MTENPLPDYLFEDERKAIIRAMQKDPDPEAGKRLVEQAKSENRYKRAGMIACTVEEQGKKWK